MSMKWIYKVETITQFWRNRPELVETALNRSGQQGWELVSVKQYGPVTYLYYKKPA